MVGALDVGVKLVEQRFDEGLGERVGEVPVGGDVVERDDLRLDLRVKVVMPQVDVLRPAVRALVLAKGQGGLVDEVRETRSKGT